MGANTATFVATSTIYVNRATLADNDAGGAAGGLRYQTGANASTFLSIGTAGQILRVNSGATAPEWIGTASVYAGAAVSSQNIFGGTAGQLHYQSAAGVTAFAGPGTAGQVLTSGGTGAPTYVTTTTLYIGRSLLADTATTVSVVAQPANATYFPIFVDSNNATAAPESLFSTSSFTVNPSTGRVGINTAAAASTLQVTGDVRISGITTVTNTTGAIATNTAAFQVAGGVGIGGGMVVGGAITATTINVVSYANYPRILNDVSNYADNVRSVFPLTVDQTAVTGLVDNRDLQVMVDGVYQAPFVRERGLPWINTVNSYRGFRVVTTGTTANFLVLYNPPDIGAQIVITQINISTSTQIRSYPYSAAMIGLGD
jgi:hypothetical protein